MDSKEKKSNRDNERNNKDDGLKNFCETITWQNSTLSKMEGDIQILSASVRGQEKFNTAIIERLDQLKKILVNNSEMLQRIYDVVSSMQPAAPNKRRRTNNDAPALVQGLLPFQHGDHPPPHDNRIPLAGDNNEMISPDNGDNNDDDKGEQSNAMDRRNKTLVKRLPNLQTLFYSWYLDELWNFQGQTSDERSFVKNTVSQLILYMKLFIPGNCTVLLGKPSPDQVELHRAWVNDLRVLSITAEERTMSFIQDYHTNVLKKALGSCVINKARTYATRKYLMQIPIDKFPPQLIVDNLSQSTSYVYNNVALELFHKCK